jgi:Glu-tRNA(Gln) amidotransferase subunit E-like FAD-binding protein
MVQTTDIEKKNLETHVELCAERYKFLEQKMQTVEQKVTGLEIVIKEVHDMIQLMTEKRNDQILNWGMGVIATLTGVIAWLIITYVAG